MEFEWWWNITRLDFTVLLVQQLQGRVGLSGVLKEEIMEKLPFAY